MRYNSLRAAALDPAHTTPTDGSTSDSEADFMRLLREQPHMRDGLITILMRYGYTLTFDAIPVADTAEKLWEAKGSLHTVRLLIDIFQHEDKERSQPQADAALPAHGGAEQQAFG